ncbi:MAG: nucleotidyltransferase family protein [Candidatus Sulfotelmatobacter sp.]
MAGAIVDSLQLSGAPYDFGQWARFSPRHWEQTLGWLDRAGLTLYLLERLRACGATEVLPPGVLARFEQNLADNRCRVDHLLYEASCINQKLDQAGVQYVVIKGFSLWPEFCSNPYLRTQCDLDYMVATHSLHSAQNALLELGYERRGRSDLQELAFERPLQRVPSQFDSPYKIQTTPMVELHVGIWEEIAHHVPLEEPTFALNSPKFKKWGGHRFPVLSEEDALLLQVLHAFQHILSHWVKLSWLLEIGRFMEKRRRDSQFWTQFSQRVEGSPRLAEFSTIALELTANVFSSPMPEIAEEWRPLLRPSVRLWLDNYGRNWALGERPPHKAKVFPESKLSLFVSGEYIPDGRARRDSLRHELMPWKIPGKDPSIVFVPVENQLGTRLQALWVDSTYTVQRLSFHGGAGLRYLWELPRWRGLTGSAR